jgi:hypothetical protein
MTISSLVPTLMPLVEQVNTDLRFVCFFILTGSIIVRTSTGHKSISQLMRPLVTSIFICGLLATLPFWFNLIRDEFWNIAVQIRTEFTGSVAGTGAALMNLLQAPEKSSNWFDVGNSIMKAVQYAFGWLIVWFAGVIQLPMMIIQYVMECLCYLFLPIALCLFAFESTKGLAMRYVQQTLAILAWPIGFAVVDLVGFSLLTTTTNVVTGGASPDGNQITFSPATYLFSGVVAIWLILGSLATPIFMQMLFCSGVPLSSSVGHSLQMGLALAGFAKLAGGGGAAPSPQTPKEADAGDSGGSGPGSGTSPAPAGPRPSPPGLPWIGPAGFLSAPASPAPAPMSPIPDGSHGLLQTPRGSLAVGKVADSISPAQAQSYANQSGTPFTQAFSNGAVTTYQPAVPKVPPASTFVTPLTSNPAFA